MWLHAWKYRCDAADCQFSFEAPRPAWGRSNYNAQVRHIDESYSSDDEPYGDETTTTAATATTNGGGDRKSFFSNCAIS